MPDFGALERTLAHGYFEEGAVVLDLEGQGGNQRGVEDVGFGVVCPYWDGEGGSAWRGLLGGVEAVGVHGGLGVGYVWYVYM